MTRIGVDTGGTFTDLVRLAADGLTVHKVRSTPDDPARAILLGIEELAEASEDFDVVHGSTVATNAVLERKGARVALITTAGFEDVLRIGRQTRRSALQLDGRGAAAARRGRLHVWRGRTHDRGRRRSWCRSIATPSPTSRSRCADAGATAVAVCFLHAYRNDAHEEAVARDPRAASASPSPHRTGCCREYREFERWSTTVVNAVRHAAHGALSRRARARALGRAPAERHAVERRLDLRRPRRAPPLCGRSSRARRPARSALARWPRRRAIQRIISFDMGGTSTDVSLIDGEIGMTTESFVGDFPVRLPIIDIHTVGAGGGSIAYLDSGRRAARRSAKCRRRSGSRLLRPGTEPTVTDANLLLGRLDASYFLGGAMTLDVERARLATRELAAQLGMRARRRWPRASCASPTPTWSGPFASCRCSAASIRGISRCSRSAAPAACTRARSPPRWTSPP